MFRWNAQMISFLRDAYDYGDFHLKLAELLSEFISPTDSVCDAGCGLGYLSLALSPYSGSVTAVDLAEEPLKVLRHNLDCSIVSNLSVVNSEIGEHRPLKPYDVMVFCFFGSLEETLAAAKKNCLREVVMVKRNHANHRFTLRERPIRGYTAGGTADALRKLGIPYIYREATFEFGQPFRYLADAVSFYKLYDKGDVKADITEASVASQLVEVTHPLFRYYLNSRREIGLFCIKVADIPDSL